MSGRWWRAYDRSRHNPKLLKLSDRLFRWWFNLVCVASEKGGVLPSHADLAAEFRVSGKVMTEVLDALIAAGLLDHGDDGIRPHDWNTLQYASDSSSNRVKAFRKRQCNVTETPSENREQRTDSVPNGTGAPAPQVDPVKLLFDEGVKLLTDSGCTERNARTIIGKWRQEQGNEIALAGIREAAAEGVTEPISWLTQRFAGKPRETAEQRRIREGTAIIEGYAHDRH